MMFNSFHEALPKTDDKEKESQIHIDLLNLLVDSKHSTDPSLLNIFHCDSYGMNPFEWAIAEGSSHCVQFFLNLMTEHEMEHLINRQNKLQSCLKGEKCKRIQNQTPIQIAVKSESIATVRHLCAYSPRPNVGICNIEQMNAIHIAIQRRLPSILYELVNIATSNDLNTHNDLGQTAQQYAESVYHSYLNKVALPSDINKAWQCKEIITARL